MTTPSPAVVYKCPNCGNFCQIGSRLMLDRISEEFPAITKCKKCQKFYWLDGGNKAGYYGGGWVYDANRDKTTPDAWKKADFVGLLSVDELQEAIDAKAYADSVENEMYLRKMLWWGLNDRAKREDAEPLARSITVQYAENCHALLALLIPEGGEMSGGGRLMVAELCKDMEMFDVCEEVLRTIKELELRGIVDRLIGECKRKNRIGVESERELGAR